MHTCARTCACAYKCVQTRAQELLHREGEAMAEASDESASQHRAPLRQLSLDDFREAMALVRPSARGFAPPAVTAAGEPYDASLYD